MRRLFFVLCMMAAGVQGAERVRSTCDESGFVRGTWQQLVQIEPALGEAFNKMVELAGSTIVRNCTVEWPSDSGRPVDGLRVAILDQQYYKNGVFQHQGLRIEYMWRLRWDSTGQNNIQREIQAFTVCRTPDSCKNLTSSPAPAAPGGAVPTPAGPTLPVS